MANKAGWEGGDNFVYSPQWGSGQTNSGEGSKKFGLARRKKRGKWMFNSQTTPCSHPGCVISAKAKIDRKIYEDSPRVVKTYRSHVN